MLSVQNDDPAHLVTSLKTLIDCAIQRVLTSATDELPDNLQRENSRGMLKKKRRDTLCVWRQNIEKVIG